MLEIETKVTDIFPAKKIAVIGDLVADQFLRGTISRVSREAPVFIMRHDETETLPGGAANAAANVVSMGGNAIVVGLIGNDESGLALSKSLNAAGVNINFLIESSKIKTTTKVRVLAGQHFASRQQVIRIDYENNGAIDEELENRLIENALNAIKLADAVIISDYNYGVASENLVERVVRECTRETKPLIVDSRSRLNLFYGATSATPNEEEVENLLGANFTDEDCQKLMNDLNFSSLLVTRGNKGMLLLEKDLDPMSIDAVGSLVPIDVTGAGDTVIAAYTLSIASGLSFYEAAQIANHAGGIVVMKSGTATASANEIVSTLSEAAKLENQA